MTNVYDIYSKYSKEYVLSIDDIREAIASLDDIKKLLDKCYYIITNVSPQCHVDHNLKLARERDDQEQILYINSVLNPKPIQKLKLKLKTVNPVNQDNMKQIYKYIFDHNLQNRLDKKVIDPDTKLRSILKPLDTTLTYYNLKHYI